MNRLLQVVGVLAAFGTGGLIFAYPFVSEAARGWVLYYAICSLCVTVAILALLGATALEALVRYLQRAEHERRRRDGSGGQAAGGIPFPPRQ